MVKKSKKEKQKRKAKQGNAPPVTAGFFDAIKFLTLK